MASPWIQHVLKTAKDKKISYKEALSVAGKTYKKPNQKPATAPKKRKVKGMDAEES